jgi:hypothetical protein
VPQPPAFVVGSLPARLPAEYAAAALSPQSAAGPLRLCVVMSRGASPAAVMLRDTLDARVYLGCVTDVRGQVHQWLEVWVQQLGGLGSAPPAYRDSVTNSGLDERWTARLRAATEGANMSIFGCGWESTHPAPMFINGKTFEPMTAQDRQGVAWELCTDDALLARKGLPIYSATLARHLYQPQAGEGSEFLPLDVLQDDPAALRSALGMPPEAVALNPGGGLMMVAPYAPHSLEEFTDTVRSGRPAANGASGTTSGARGGWLNLAGGGVGGRLVEALHVQLMIFSGCVAQVRDAAMSSQTPLLNLSAGSFRVFVQAGTPALPAWWTARPALTTPGDAAELNIPGAATRYFLPARVGGLSIYAPASMARTAAGRGSLRLRNILSEGGGSIIECTLASHERFSTTANDLVWLRATVEGARIDLHATVDTQGGMSAGEVRLRTAPHKLPPATLERLRAAMGVPIPDVMFEVIPMLSTPCDLYALGVIGVRLLLADDKHPLPVVLDDLFSLATAAAGMMETGHELPERIEQAFISDKRFAQSLGPQRLLADGGTPESAFAAVPPKLWFGVLAALVRMMTRVSPDSRCKDYGDAPASAVHRVFDSTVEDLYALLCGCRALIVPDQQLNAEVRSVVRDCLASATR